MTARERAMGLIAELTSLDTGYDCCLTGESAINVIRTALADAERGGMLRAAKGLEDHVVYAPSNEAHDNEVGTDGDGTSYNQGVRAAIEWIRAQANQEEG